MKMESMLMMLMPVLRDIAMDESQPATVRLLVMKLLLTEAGPKGGAHQRSGRLPVTARKQPRNSGPAWTR